MLSNYGLSRILWIAFVFVEEFDAILKSLIADHNELDNVDEQSDGGTSTAIPQARPADNNLNDGRLVEGDALRETNGSAFGDLLNAVADSTCAHSIGQPDVEETMEEMWITLKTP